MVSKNRIGNHSKNLLAAVATRRENDDAVGSIRRKHPVGLIAHFDRMIVPSYLLLMAWEALSVRTYGTMFLLP